MARRRTPRFIVWVLPANPPPWWPRDAQGRPERVYTNNGTDWDLTRPTRWRDAVTAPEAMQVIANWRSFYATERGQRSRRWRFGTEPWIYASGKSA